MSYLVIGLCVFVVLMCLVIFISKYQTANPDEALIISGSYLGVKNVFKDDSGNKIKIVRGGRPCGQIVGLGVQLSLS